MTAVMQIPKNPPPVLKNPRQWCVTSVIGKNVFFLTYTYICRSPEFNDFLKECFIKDPAFRQSAKALLNVRTSLSFFFLIASSNPCFLQHPFFKNTLNDTGQILVPLIKRTKAAEEAYSHSSSPPTDVPEPPDETPGSPLADEFSIDSTVSPPPPSLSPTKQRNASI